MALYVPVLKMLVLNWGCGRILVQLSTYYQCTGFVVDGVLDVRRLGAQKSQKLVSIYELDIFKPKN